MEKKNMANVASRIMEAFQGLIPDEKKSVVEEAIKEFMTESEKKIREEYEKTLEESYAEWNTQLEQAREEGKLKAEETEKTAYEGYEQAREIIEQLNEKLQTQKDEFEAHMEREFSVAKAMIDEEKAKNDKIEEELYEAYSKQVEDLKEDLVNKIDAFLESKVVEISESVRKELKNDPDVLETKVAFDRIKDIVASCLTSNDIESSTAAQVESLEDTIANMQQEIKTLKAKTMRLTTENQKYVEELKVLSESNTENDESAEKRSQIRKEAERMISEKNAQNVTGHGKVVDEIITEKADGEKKDANDNQIIEAVQMTKAELRKLAGF